MSELPIDIEVSVDHLRAFTYAYLNTTRSAISRIAVRNVGSERTSGTPIRPRVIVEAPFDEMVCDSWEGAEQDLPQPATVDPPIVTWSRIPLRFNPSVLGRLAERVNAALRVELLAGDQVVWSKRFPVTLLAANEWLHDDSFHDALAAFVLPNSSALRPSLDGARRLLDERTGDPSTQGYQLESHDLEKSMHRVVDMARAVYDSLQAVGLNYSNPPADFTGHVQRVRSPQTVFAERAATCLDSSVLYASAIAQVGLDPVIFLVSGHAFAGVFLLERPAQEASSVVTNRGEMVRLVERGLVLPVETTTLCAGPGRASFEAAVSSATTYFGSAVEDLESMVVVRGAWRQGIAPPPRISSSALEEVEEEHPAHLMSAGKPAHGRTDFHDDDGFEYDGSERDLLDRPPPRVRQWMNSLLDLSTRNSLLKMSVRQKNGKEAAKFIEFKLPPSALAGIDDRLFTPRSKLVLQTPADLPAKYKSGGISIDEFLNELPSLQSPLMYPPYDDLNALPSLVAREIAARDAGKHDRRLTDLDIERQLHQRYRDVCLAQLHARVSKVRSAADERMLASGSNPLHLALGALSWSEESSGRTGDRSRVEFLAPLFLYPVVMDGGKGVPYSIRLDSSGSISPNYCLHEKLRRPPYNLELPELTQPLMDERGIDLDAMLTSIENKLRAEKLDHFAVQRRCVLGVFDYSTFRLWKDLHDGWQQMRDTSPAVRHLMYTPGERMIEETSLGEREECEPYCPIEADDSQVEAIRWALKGRSFRLEGPPGTGKTQTITNLIASCLAHDRKVLFVAEKQTALQQVKKRLHSIGLGDYCLELHSKGDSDARIRKNIRDQVGGALEASADLRTGDWENLTARLRLEQQALDDYRDALHQLGPAELSLWKAQEGLALHGDSPAVRIPRSFLDRYSEFWPQFRDIDFELQQAERIAGGALANPWRAVDSLDFFSLNRGELTASLDDLQAALSEFRRLRGEWADAVEEVHRPVELVAVLTAAMLPLQGVPLAADAFDRGVGGPTWRNRVELLLVQLEASIDKLRPRLAILGSGFAARDDLDSLAAAASVAQSAKWLAAGRRAKDLQAQIGGPALAAEGTDIVQAVPNAVHAAKSIRSLVTELRTETSLVVPESLLADVDDLVASVRRTVSSLDKLESAQPAPHVLRFVERFATSSSPDRASAEVVSRLVEAWERFETLAGIGTSGIERWRGERTWRAALEASLDEWFADGATDGRYLKLQRWATFAEAANRLVSCGLGELRAQVLGGEVDLSQLGEMVQRGILITAIDERLEAGSIDHFDGRMHELHIERLERTMAKLREVMAERIPGLILSRRTQRRSSRGAGPTEDLLRELTRTRGPKAPIRSLIERYGPALVETMPCFMMSPDSVATLLPVGSITFDLVIFDEASQVRTSHAIGALGRGRANIVVGDSKQMPPTSAFSSNIGRLEEADEFDDDEQVPEAVEGAEEIEIGLELTDPFPTGGVAVSDVESILQEFEASSVAHLQLLCHYRSKDELLIAFSNAEIYERPMLTFPSTAGMSSTALEYRRVDGQYLRKRTVAPNPTDPSRNYDFIRTNPVEALAVVEEVLGRLRDPERRARRAAGKRSGDESIIVVTFNKPQQELIRLLLEGADDSADPVVTLALQEEKDDDTGVLIAEPQLKIRNLETVQGDEAETVIFSVAFSKLAPGERASASNRVPLNFGPVTQEGGYRRLNVAVTRAQRKMIVYSSFDPADMDVKPTSSEGARLVQKFLMLAKYGPKSSGDIGVGGSRSRHIDEIATAIADRGYRVHTQLGLSSLRVDIAAGLPGSDKWTAAIIVDGPAWADRGSAYQREILPKNILGSLGWAKVIRIWLPMWRQEREFVIESVVAALEETRVEKVEVGAGHEVAPPLAVPSEQTTDTETVVEDPAPTVAATTDHVTAPDHAPEPDSEGDDASVVAPALERVVLRREAATQPPPSTTPVTLEQEFSPFTPTDRGEVGVLDLMHSGRARLLVLDAIKDACDAEAPIDADRLGRLVAKCFGLNTVRAKRIEDILSLVPPQQIEVTEGGKVIWKSAKQRKNWIGYRTGGEPQRPFAQIPLIELAFAIVDAVAGAAASGPKDPLGQAAAKFGVQRLGPDVRGRLEAAVALGVKRKMLARAGDKLTVHPSFVPQRGE